MRKEYREILKNCFHAHLISKPKKKELNHSETAAHLLMSSRAYYDLEQGKFCCSALTLALYLIYLCRDVPGFLEELQRELEEAGILFVIENE